MNNKLIIETLNDTLSGVDLAKKFNVSPAYISTIKKTLNQLKYKPIIRDGQLYCTQCKETSSKLMIHHVHETGQLIAIVCRSCNAKLKQSDLIDEDFKIAIKDTKQLVLYVQKDFPFGGADVKRELEDLFQFAWDNTDMFEKYEKIMPAKAAKVKEMLGGW